MYKIYLHHVEREREREENRHTHTGEITEREERDGSGGWLRFKW